MAASRGFDERRHASFVTDRRWIGHGMGAVMDLAEFRLRRLARQQSGTTSDGPIGAEFYFDLASPFSYLAAERVERAFTTVAWVPAFARALRRPPVDPHRERAS